MRALVTGASGFVGGHLCEHLVAEGDLVVGLSRSGHWPPPLAHLDQSVRLEQGDIASVETTTFAAWLERKRPEVVYHLAAQSNPSASFADPRGTWTLNLVGTLNLLEAVKAMSVSQRPRVILVSSGVCYGNPTPVHLPVSEECPLRPTNPYGASKAAADLLGIQHYLAHGTDIVIVRPFNHAGPRQSPAYVLAVLTLQVARVEAGLTDHVAVGNLDVIRDFTDVRDVVRSYRLLTQRGKAGEIYNLGTGHGTKLSDALEYLRTHARHPIDVRVDPARVRSIDQPLLIADSCKLRSATGWEACYTVEQTLADMLEHCRRDLNS
jgi:GDP-4-dehydro-6-deoxy-D-mannose reductase